LANRRSSSGISGDDRSKSIGVDPLRGRLIHVCDRSTLGLVIGFGNASSLRLHRESRQGRSVISKAIDRKEGDFPVDPPIGHWRFRSLRSTCAEAGIASGYRYPAPSSCLRDIADGADHREAREERPDRPAETRTEETARMLSSSPRWDDQHVLVYVRGREERADGSCTELVRLTMADRDPFDGQRRKEYQCP
jgi:hypothetical protein